MPETSSTFAVADGSSAASAVAVTDAGTVAVAVAVADTVANSIAVVLNIAEARGSQGGNARARFETACASAGETRAALGVAADFAYIDAAAAERIDAALDIVCAITWCLARRR